MTSVQPHRIIAFVFMYELGELLASQAAISLENAALYSDLQRENADRKRAEGELRRSEAYLTEAQRLSRTGSFGWNVSSGELFWSDETFRIFGYEKALSATVYMPFNAPSGRYCSRAIDDRPRIQRREGFRL
jgi:PAS domain-containing protein